LKCATKAEIAIKASKGSAQKSSAVEEERLGERESDSIRAVEVSLSLLSC